MEIEAFMSRKQLLFVDTVKPDAQSQLKKLVEADTAIVCLNDATKDALESMGFSCKIFREYLTREDWLSIDQEAVDWFKSIPETLLDDKSALKEAFAHEGTSFWWIVEEGLVLNGGLFDFVKLYHAIGTAIEREKPTRVYGMVSDKASRLIIDFHSHKAGRSVSWDEHLPAQPALTVAEAKARLKRLLILTMAILSFLSPLKLLFSILVGSRRRARGYRPSAGCVMILSFVPYSWRLAFEPETGTQRLTDTYWDAFEKESSRSRPDKTVLHVAVRSNRVQDRTLRGRLLYTARLLRHIPEYIPLRHYGTVKTCLCVARRSRLFLRRWRAIIASGSTERIFSYGGVDFSQVIAPRISQAVFSSLPTGLRLFEEMKNAIRKERPGVAVLNGETTITGRALVAACRTENVPTVGLQHGCVSVMPSMHASYYHASPDCVNHESARHNLGCPIPTRTAVLGEYFKQLLINRMHYPPDAVVVTGSPRYDVLVRRDLYDKEHLRKQLGLEADKLTILLATAGATMKSDFQPPHNNRVHLAAVLDCLDQLNEAQVIVKLHPLDDTSLYGTQLERAKNHPAVRVVKDEDILALLSVSDILIARYSGTIIEAAVFDKPSINLNLLETPDNIEFVAEGGALGITDRDKLLEGIRALMDPNSQASRGLRDNRAEFIRQWVHTIDGKAAARLVEVVVDLSEAASTQTASREKDNNV